MGEIRLECSVNTCNSQVMPTEEHFGEHKRAAQVPPWGATSEPPSQKEARENNAGVFTTYQWYHKGLRTTPGQPQRNSTTNHFDAEISCGNDRTRRSLFGRRRRNFTADIE